MRLIIGSTTIDNVKSCTRMRNAKLGFYLDIQIPKDSIGMDELCTLLTDNEETITVITAEGNENAYKGFRALSYFALEDGVYKIYQVATSEIEAQLSIAQNKVAAINAVVEAQTFQLNEQTKVINQQTEVIRSQGETLTTQQETIKQQTTAIRGLETANAELKAAQELNDAELLYQVCLLQLGVTDDNL